ncbi:MAG: hypothetical protein ABSC55_29045 [Syntrophorhabdales bacterium]|jgi:hypothetical protein
MTRELVTEEELIRILNNELAKDEDSKGYSFDNGLLRLAETDENGCN